MPYNFGVEKGNRLRVVVSKEWKPHNSHRTKRKDVVAGLRYFHGVWIHKFLIKKPQYKCIIGKSNQNYYWHHSHCNLLQIQSKSFQVDPIMRKTNREKKKSISINLQTKLYIDRGFFVIYAQLRLLKVYELKNG